MGSINAIRLLNSVVAGTTDSAALETALATRRGEWQGLFAMPGQLGKMIESDTAWNTIKGSSTALTTVAASAIGANRIIARRLASMVFDRPSIIILRDAGDPGMYAALSSYASWTTRTSGFGTIAIRGVTYGNGLYVAVGASGKLTTSPDGITWTARTSGFGAITINGVTYGNGLYVAVGGNGVLTTSPDGITWTARTSGLGIPIYGVTYGNGLYVAVGEGGVLTTSPDGITWTARTSGFGTTHIYGVTYGNGLYVAVGASGVLTTSPDGITWTARTSGFGTTYINGVTYGNGLYVAVGDSGKLTTSVLGAL